MTLAEVMDLTEKRVLAEMKIKELEAKIDALTLSLGKTTRKTAPKKELTPEEAETLKAKRSEAGKKAAAKRAEKAAAKKEAERLALIAELKQEILSETSSEELVEVSDSNSVSSEAESHELV
jgi:hypothetical protein